MHVMFVLIYLVIIFAALLLSLKLSTLYSYNSECNQKCTKPI